MLTERANRQISSKEPNEYIRLYKIDKEFLDQQLIPSNVELDTKHYMVFLKERAKLLRKAALKYFSDIKPSERS